LDGSSVCHVGLAVDLSIRSKGDSMNTIEQHNKQVNEALIFLGKARFTTAKHLQMVAGRNRRGFPSQLKRMGLILSRELSYGITIFGLSQKGANLIGAKKIDIHKIRLGCVEHSLIAQHETLSSIEEFGLESYEFEPQKSARDSRPDVVWVTKDGIKYFVEIELSPKSIVDGELDRFFEKLTSRNSIVVFKDMQLERYLKYARRYVDNGIPEWKMVDKQWFKTGGFMKVDLEAWQQVFFKQHGCSPMSIYSYLKEGLI